MCHRHLRLFRGTPGQPLWAVLVAPRSGYLGRYGVGMGDALLASRLPDPVERVAEKERVYFWGRAPKNSRVTSQTGGDFPLLYRLSPT